MRAHKGARSNGRKSGETPSDASKTAIPAGFFVRMGERDGGGVRAFERAFEGPENDVRTAVGRSGSGSPDFHWTDKWTDKWTDTFSHGIIRKNVIGRTNGRTKSWQSDAGTGMFSDRKCGERGGFGREQGALFPYACTLHIYIMHLHSACCGDRMWFRAQKNVWITLRGYQLTCFGGAVQWGSPVSNSELQNPPPSCYVYCC